MCQILADVFDVEIVTVNVTEGAAYGAALLAGVGTGVYRDIENACAKTIRGTDEIKPFQGFAHLRHALFDLTPTVSRTRSVL